MNTQVQVTENKERPVIEVVKCMNNTAYKSSEIQADINFKFNGEEYCLSLRYDFLMPSKAYSAVLSEVIHDAEDPINTEEIAIVNVVDDSVNPDKRILVLAIAALATLFNKPSFDLNNILAVPPTELFTWINMTNEMYPELEQLAVDFVEYSEKCAAPELVHSTNFAHDFLSGTVLCDVVQTIYHREEEPIGDGMSSVNKEYEFDVKQANNPDHDHIDYGGMDNLRLVITAIYETTNEGKVVNGNLYLGFESNVDSDLPRLDILEYVDQTIVAESEEHLLQLINDGLKQYLVARREDATRLAEQGIGDKPFVETAIICVEKETQENADI